jgi:hypothetical protein
VVETDGQGAILDYARDRKEKLLTEADHLLLVIRGNDPVAALNSGNLNELLGVAKIAAAGYGADALALVIESVVPLIEVNPLTNRPWEPGEAESSWQEQGGVEKGWVAEAQLIVVATHGDDVYAIAQLYRVEGGLVIWGAISPGVELGVLQNMLAASLGGPVIDPARVPESDDLGGGDPANGPFYDANYGRVVLDVGATRVLGQRLLPGGEASLVVESNERAEALVAEGLPVWQVEVWDPSNRVDPSDG